MRRSRSVLTIIAVLAACVSYDPTGPHAEAITGTYATIVAITLTSDIETRHDTPAATLVLRDSSYRGRFDGYYRFSDGDSGHVAGTLRDAGVVFLSHFGPWPPLSHVGHLQRLYPQCQLAPLDPIFISGQLHGDTLRVGGAGPVLCAYQVDGATVQRASVLEFGLVGIRQ